MCNPASPTRPLAQHERLRSPGPQQTLATSRCPEALDPPTGSGRGALTVAPAHAAPPLLTPVLAADSSHQSPSPLTNFALISHAAAGLRCRLSPPSPPLPPPPSVFGLGCEVFGVQSSVFGLWSLLSACSLQSTVFGLWPSVCGLQSTIFRLWSSVFDLRSLVFGLQSTVFGLSISVFGLQILVFGLRSRHFVQRRLLAVAGGSVGLCLRRELKANFRS